MPKEMCLHYKVVTTICRQRMTGYSLPRNQIVLASLPDHWVHECSMGVHCSLRYIPIRKPPIRKQQFAAYQSVSTCFAPSLLIDWPNVRCCCLPIGAVFAVAAYRSGERSRLLLTDRTPFAADTLSRMPSPTNNKSTICLVNTNDSESCGSIEHFGSQPIKQNCVQQIGKTHEQPNTFKNQSFDRQLMSNAQLKHHMRMKH